MTLVERCTSALTVGTESNGGESSIADMSKLIAEGSPHNFPKAQPYLNRF
ncbi:hypothetical protein LL266_15465 [Vibrio anguillarum]|nr:hypothetical protein [Vibrio anguillarum]